MSELALDGERSLRDNRCSYNSHDLLPLDSSAVSAVVMSFPWLQGAQGAALSPDLQLDNNLAGGLAVGEIVESLLGVFEGERWIHVWRDLARVGEPGQLIELANERAWIALD